MHGAFGQSNGMNRSHQLLSSTFPPKRSNHFWPSTRICGTPLDWRSAGLPSAPGEGHQRIVARSPWSCTAMEARARSTNSLSFVSENDFELYCFSKCLRSGFFFFFFFLLMIWLLQFLFFSFSAVLLYNWIWSRNLIHKCYGKSAREMATGQQRMANTHFWPTAFYQQSRMLKIVLLQIV